MKRVEEHTIKTSWGRPFGVGLMVLFMSSRLLAFQSTQEETISCGVMIGGPVINNGPLKIQHDPLTSISDVTKQIVILTEAGEEIPPGAVRYEARINPASVFGPLPTRQIRMRVLYRFLDPQNPVIPPLSETPVVEGPDPIAAAFEIPRSEVTGPILQYRIVAERIQYVGNQLIVIATNTFPIMTVQEPDPFVSVGVQANAAQILGVSGGRFAVDDGNPADGQTSVDIPNGLLHENTVVTIDQLPTNSPIIPSGLTSPIVVYRFDSEPKANGLMHVSLLYPDFEFPRGQDGIVDGTDIPERELSVVWWDGFRWKNLGRGEIIDATTNALNVPDNTISVNVGSLNFMAVVRAAALSATDRRPFERVITPNNDGTNDVLNFTFGDRSDNIKVEIFDITGHRVRTLMSSSTLQWDGRDDAGKIVDSGVYIYQYSVDGTNVSGLVAVAK